MILRYVFLVIISFSSGVVIAGGVFAFIVIIGIIPRLIQKTQTRQYVILYENCIVLGGIVGLGLIFQIPIPIHSEALNFIFGSFAGIFIGCLAVSLAEILDVVPIMTRRARIKTGLQYFILAVSLGKFLGSMIYFFMPGFVEFK